MRNFNEDLEKVLRNQDIKDRYWFANKVLYKLCSDHPDVDGDGNRINPDEFVAKLWLIGRSYAAAIERRDYVNIKKLDYNDDFTCYAYDFYYDSVYNEFEKSNEYFDLFKKLKNVEEVNDVTIKTIIKTHKVLMDIFTKICGKEKRSLASKYLHFHFPNLFYIYDSRANDEIDNYVAAGKKNNKNESYDEQYLNFYMKCYSLKKEYNNYSDNNREGIEKYFTRLLDTVLLVSAAKTAEENRKTLLDRIKNGEFDNKEKDKINNSIEVYKSCALREELINYLNKNNNYNKEIKEKIEKRWQLFNDI